MLSDRWPRLPRWGDSVFAGPHHAVTEPHGGLAQTFHAEADEQGLALVDIGLESGDDRLVGRRSTRSVHDVHGEHTGLGDRQLHHVQEPRAGILAEELVDGVGIGIEGARPACGPR